MAVEDETSKLLSVIITCYNYESYVGLAIDSVIQQGGCWMEIIVVDDGSTDSSWQIISSYGNSVRSIRTKNQGALKAALAGFGVSKGRFIFFLDADDALRPGAMGELLKHLRPEVTKVQFMLRPINSAGKPIGQSFPSFRKSQRSEDLIRQICIQGYYNSPPTSGNIYRRDVYEGLGDLSYERAIDGVPYLLAPFIGTVVSIEMPLGLYRIHGANLSAFDRLSAARMFGYADRFQARIGHLKKLLEQRGLPHFRAFIRDEFCYVQEARLIGKVSEGNRPAFSEVCRAIKLAALENSPLPTFVKTIFYLLLYILPCATAKKLAHLRVNQSYLSPIRRILKRIAPLS